MSRPTIAEAIAGFEADADEGLVKDCRAIVSDGRAAWVHDPQVEGTVGLLITGTNQALVVVYAPPAPDALWDFEVDMDQVLDQMVAISESQED